MSSKLTVRSAHSPQSSLPLLLKTTPPRALFTLQRYLDKPAGLSKGCVCRRALNGESASVNQRVATVRSGIPKLAAWLIRNVRGVKISVRFVSVTHQSPPAAVGAVSLNCRAGSCNGTTMAAGSSANKIANALHVHR